MKTLKSILQALSFLVIGVLLFAHVPLSFAQADQGWSKPVNLSLSGTATAPLLVIDSDGVLHAIWVDEVDKVYGYRYSQSTDGVTWTQPKRADYPFDSAGAPPVFLVGANGWIHVFWISNNNLFYARVIPQSLSDPSQWVPSTSRLAQDVANFDAIQDSQGAIHLAYVHNLSSATTPAGIYYRQSSGNGYGWTAEAELYESEYYRSATIHETSVRIAASNVLSGQRVYVVWDSRPEKRVFMAVSEDSGRSWSDARQFKSIQDYGGIDTPFNINVAAAGDKVLMTWQAGQPGSQKCSVFSQWSQDGGKSWGGVASAFNGRTTCPTSSKFISQKEDYIVALMTGPVDTMLLAWNGGQWSAPEAQTELPLLSNPLTYDSISLGCRYTVVRDDRLYVVGCDQAGGGDVWFLSRALDPASKWFSPPMTWGLPGATSVQAEGISSLASVPDRDGMIHAVWADSSVATDGSVTVSLEYARWDGKQWTRSDRAIASLGSMPSGISLTIDSQDRLLLSWSDGEGGGLYFSWANADRAHTASEWAQPASLPSMTALIDSQDIMVDGSGRIVVVYAISLNEGRGIYMVQSTDSGKSWSVPAQIFDAVSAHWEKIGRPRISLGKGGVLHVIFTRSSVQTGQPLGLYYSRSMDGGTTWTDPQPLSQGDIRWSDIVSYDDGTVHALWQEYDGLVFANLSRVSVDGGGTWSKEHSITGVNQGPTLVALADGGSKELHFIQLLKDSNETTLTQEALILQDWKWDGSAWGLASSSNLTMPGQGVNYSLAAEVTSKGFLDVLMSAVHPDSQNASQNEVLAFDRFLQESGPSGETPVSLIPTPIAQPNVTAIPSGLPTQSADLSALRDNGSSASSILKNIAGILLVGGVMAAAVLVTFRWGRNTTRK